ncbi:hypothetical protein C0995_002530 [Termitomyces sp. Mi166|nr:hypothetical protein C0995_002530 [Termitomyces sp. Mi166\
MKESFPSNLMPNDYLEILMAPVVDVFNQLRRLGRGLLNSTHFKLDELGKEIYGQDQSFPVIVVLPDELFHLDYPSLSVTYALSQIHELSSLVSPTIIVTNFKDIAVFHPAYGLNAEPFFERVAPITQFSLALQVIAVACTNNALPYVWMRSFSPEFELDLSHGPSQDPHQPLLGDEQVFTTHHFHSDFDIPTLVQNKARALQFFRWHAHIQQQYSKVVACPKDILVASTNKASFIHDLPRLVPLYPYDASELPVDTVAHVKETQCPCPLGTARISKSLNHNKTFPVEIVELIATSTERGICTLYRCRITSIDGHVAPSSPSLCLELLDDRFQGFDRPNEEDPDDLDDREFSRWMVPIVMAEMLATNEFLAYEKLRPLQGSIVPWFYGLHQFTLPDGRILYGFLMEYIWGWKIESNLQRELSIDRQIKLIQSSRHAARVLDVSDIGQHDWHEGQVLFYTNPTTGIDHAILVDFGLTSQTYEEEMPNLIDNYSGMRYTLNKAFDQELVLKHL